MWFFASPGLAQEVEQAESQEVRTDLETGERYVPARPPQGPLRGALSVPGWTVYIAGALVSAVAFIVVVRRLRRRP